MKDIKMFNEALFGKRRWVLQFQLHSLCCVVSTLKIWWLEKIT